ncbi:unnamed protein product [Ectocarpus sp. 4 AP-2014]
MKSAGETAADVLILAAVTTYSCYSLCHTAAMWKMRKQFFIALRSPALGCVHGVCGSLRCCSLTYICILYDYYGNAQYGQVFKFTGAAAVAQLIGSPVSLIGVLALIAWVFRVIALYDPKQRKRWGRFIKDKRIARALCWTYGGLAVVIWASAYVYGIDR